MLNSLAEGLNLAYGEGSEAKWAKLEPLVPPLRSAQKGHPFVEVLNCIFWRLQTGSGGCDVPELRCALNLLQLLCSI